MDFAPLLAALAVPVVLGGLWCDLLVPHGAPARTAMVWGHGTLAGLLGIPVLMRALHAAGIAPVFANTVIAAGVLIAAALALRWRRRRADTPPCAAAAPLATIAPLQRALLCLLAALLLLRFGSLLLELLWRPLSPFDATMHWATKSRVWFEHGTIVPFVHNQQWLQMGGEGVFTDHHPDYPQTIPLLQFWVLSAIGRWDGSLMNLPWLLCLAALGAAFFAQARAAGAGVVASMTFTYLLLSLPLVNTHVALAGYADLFMGACYGAALMAFCHWSMHRQSWQGWIALLFALACPLIKNEGVYWLATFVPALMVLLLPRRLAVLLIALGVTVVAALVVLLPDEFSFAGHTKAHLDFYLRPEAPRGIAFSLFVQDNWHLLAYLLVALAGLALAYCRQAFQTYLPLLVALGSALALFLFLFTYTRYAGGAMYYTAVGRISLHLVPGMLFFCAVLWRQVWLARQIPAGGSTTTTA